MNLFPTLAILASGIVYYPVVNAYFFADDFLCMLRIENESALRFVGEFFGGHMLFARNLIFYAWYRLFGFQPQPYYWAILVTHLLNVWLLFRILRSLTDHAALACLGAAIWGASPLAKGALGWYSVYGQVLVATILLILLDQLLRRGEEQRAISSRPAIIWYALLLVATGCFGIGIGVAWAFPGVLFLVRPAAWRQARLRNAFLALPVVVVALYFGLRAVYGVFFSPSLDQVILGRVALSHYLPIVVMTWHLIAFGITGLLLGFSFSPEQYPGAGSHVTVTLFFAAFLAVLLTADGMARRRILAAAIICLAAYGMVAIGRSNVYLMFKTDTYVAARAARFHYVGTLPLAILLCLVLRHAARRAWLHSALVPAVLLIWIVTATYGFTRSGWTIEQREDCRRYVATTLHRIDMIIDAQPIGQHVYIENEEVPKFLMGPMLGHELFPGWAGLFVLAYRKNDVRGRHVHFIERRPLVLTALGAPGTNRRLAGLLVGPEAVARTTGER